MKKILTILLALTMVFGLAACGSEKPQESSKPVDDGGKKLSIALLVPYIGDQSYFDVVNNGLKLAAELPGVTTKLIEMGAEENKWETAYLDAAESGYDIIIGGNWQAEPYLNKVAEQYPDQKFINFDFSNAEMLPNVYGVSYKTDELGFVAGLVAGAVTKSTMPNANDKQIIGAIAGSDSNDMNDFIGGYMQGALAINPDVKVLTAYVGNFTDVAKAKEQALNMYKTGADVIYHAAGGAGNGVFEAAVEAKGYAVGVDSDQTLTFSEKPEIAATIISSATKNCDQALLRAIKLALEDKLPYGTSEVLGLKENGVGLARNAQFESMVPADIKAEILRLETELKDKKISIKSVKATPEIWADLKASLDPNK